MSSPSFPMPLEVDVLQRRAFAAGAAALLASLVGALANPDQFFHSYLFAFLFWNGMALGCLAILLMHHVVGGKWGMLIRRLCEAGARTLPFMALLLIPILLGMTTLYLWARPEAVHDANIQSKAAYLNVPFFIGRTVFYFAIWFLYSYLLSKWSAAQDRAGLDHLSNERLIGKMRALSAPGLVVFR